MFILIIKTFYQKNEMKTSIKLLKYCQYGVLITIWRQGLGSNHVDFGGKIYCLSAFANISVIAGDLTKKTGSV
jgi:hypothetical protein